MVILGAILSIVAWLAWSMLIAQHAMSELGGDATQQDIQRLVEQRMMEGKLPTHPVPAGLAIVSAVLGLAGVILAVRSLVRNETGRGMAIAACVVGALFLVCQMMLMFLLLGLKGSGAG